jgi:RES domain-containing protein
MIEHSETGRLERAVGRVRSRSLAWNGVVYRSASPRYASGEDLLTGLGSKRAGARWNSPGSFQAVYTSLDPHTALDEVLAHFRYYGLSIESAMPRVIVSVRVKLERALDITDRSIRSALHVSLKRLISEPWRIKQELGEEALTQALGRVVKESRLEGLLVPSAASKSGVNLIILPENLLPRSRIEIINVDQLRVRL